MDWLWMDETRSGIRSTLKLAALSSCLLCGCATVTGTVLGPPPDSTKLPIDDKLPLTSLRWSFLWGQLNEVWLPFQCASGSTGPGCIARDPCEGLGIGKVEAKLPFYAVPLAVLTLGTVVPLELTYYCSTYRPGTVGP